MSDGTRNDKIFSSLYTTNQVSVISCGSQTTPYPDPSFLKLCTPLYVAHAEHSAHITMGSEHFMYYDETPFMVAVERNFMEAFDLQPTFREVVSADRFCMTQVTSV